MALLRRTEPRAAAALERMREAVFTDGALSAAEKHLIAAAVAATRGDREGTASHAARALQAGAAPEQVLEAFLPPLLSHGPSAWETAAAAVQALGLGSLPEPTAGPAPEEPGPAPHGADPAPQAAGQGAAGEDTLAYYRRDLGHVPPWVDVLDRYARPYLEGYTQLRRAVLRDGHLSRRIKELVIVGCHAAHRYPRGAGYHVRGALRQGATPAQVAETFLVAAAAAGIPGWLEAPQFLEEETARGVVPGSPQPGNDAAEEQASP